MYHRCKFAHRDNILLIEFDEVEQNSCIIDLHLLQLKSMSRNK